MPYSLSLKSLSQLRWRQLIRGKKKRDLVGPIVLLVYFWGLEVLFFIMFREHMGSFPAQTATMVCLSMIFPDFLFKLIFLRDHSVMDPFLKTRPVFTAQWNRFLTLSQLWNPDNLIMPVLMLPACLLFLPFPRSLVVWVALYLLSVLSGILVMLLKRRGPYAPEKTVTKAAGYTVKSGAGHAIFGLQSRSLKRSKRLKRAIIYLTIFFFLEFLLYGWQGEFRYYSLYLFFFITMASVMLAQYGLGVEANSFGAIWTRPIPVSRILRDKFWFSAALGGAAALIAIPFCIWFGISVFMPVSFALFSTGFGGPFMLIDAYNCTPFDLFGKTFFNYQGSRGTFKASVMLGTLVIVLVGMFLPELLPGWPCYLILSGLGLLGFLFHRPYFDWVERKFLKDKYKYMEKYQSR